MAADVFGIVGTKQAGVFRVERVVAEGGFAVVYRAMHEGFRAPVALKCLKVPEAMTEDGRAQFLEKFREEGELLFRLSALSPSVVRPLHVDVLPLDGGRIVPFLALEWLEGEGLDAVIDRARRSGARPMDVRALVELLAPAARALAQAHHMPTDAGPIAIIHRDLKPENIFVCRAQGGAAVKILDFGIARTKSAATLHAGRVTQGGALDAFTPGYAAPEQWLPKRYGQVGPWTDVFGLAMTMVEVLAGKPPIEGDLAAMMGTTNDPTRRPTPRTEGVRVSDAVEAAFAGALAVDPRERTQSIEAFWSALEAAVGLAPSIRVAGQPVSARSLESARTAPAVDPFAPTASPEPKPGLAPTMVEPITMGETPKPPAQPVQSASPPKRAPAPPQPQAAPPAQPAAPKPQPAPQPRRAPERPAAHAMDFELAEPVRARNKGTLAAPDLASGRRAVDLRGLLRAPIQLVAVAIVLSLADWGYTQATSDVFAVSGVRPAWISAPIAIIGVGLACWRIVATL